MVVRWRRVDLRDELQRRFGVALHERSVGKILYASSATANIQCASPQSPPEHGRLSMIRAVGISYRRGRSSTELIQHATERRMRAVLDLDPAIEPAAAILAVLRNESLQSHHAGVAEQVRADLILLEVAQEDAIDALSQQPGEVGLAPPLLNPVFEITKH